MADVSGPCSTLPGSQHKVPQGTMCDDHENTPAVMRIQGETDSFGAEYMDLCQACADEYKTNLKEHGEEHSTGCCDWCKSRATDLRYKRDFEEGMSGPVYSVCGACVRKENKYLEQEMDDHGERY